MAEGAFERLKRMQEDLTAIFAGKPEAFHEEKQQSNLLTFVHFWVMVGKSFVRNRCPVRASALAYTTLLALVPMLAVAISVSSSLLKKEGAQGIEQLIVKLVANVTPETSKAVSELPTDARVLGERKEIARRINEFVQNIQSGALGATGMIALVFMGIAMLSRIEDTFNDIWGVTQGRSWFARIVQYWAALTLGPLLIVGALALTSGPHFDATRQYLTTLPFVGEQLVSLMFRLLPFFILSLAFAVFYQLMPNTKVEWRAAWVGGMVGGCLWQLNNIFSVLYVSRVVTNSKIYGSLGMVPVLMIGLYFSWIILLFGAQVAYAYQNRRAYIQERQVESISQRGREFVALRLMTLIGERFQKAEKAPSVAEMSDLIGVPSRLVSQVLGMLMQGKLAAEVSARENSYIPARPLDGITCQNILDAVRAGRGEEIETRDDMTRDLLRDRYRQIQQAESQVAGHMTLEALVKEAGDRKV
ncbi:MAG: YhjD/YihY/BrkB family envelope integrity protein [Verrucomicrobiota bacterium]